MTIHHSFRPALLICALAAAACSPEAEPADPLHAPPPIQAPVGPQATPPESRTRGGDGSAITLTPLTEPDFAADPLQGELACSFAADGAAQPLLVARGFADNAAGWSQGLARIGDYPERLMATSPGGFDAMIVGARFAGRGMTYTITLDRSAAAGSGESPANPARMLLQRADGAELTIPGTWTCGP